MKNDPLLNDLITLERFPRKKLALLPTPVQPLENFQREFQGIELWMKRDDLTGFEGGGNKTRKLEFLVGDAIERGADTLVTIGAIQSNHTRQTAAAAAKSGLKAALLHLGWTSNANENYRKVGNILLSSLMGGELFLDDTPRPIEDQSPLEDFSRVLLSQGRKPYVIPGGGSEHKLGSLGYITCAAEILKQCKESNVTFDYIVHCTGSSSTQAGLVAGLTALKSNIKVIGVSDDHEVEIKKKRVLALANDTLALIGSKERVGPSQVEIIASDHSDYGTLEDETLDYIKKLATSEGIIADPVYEGKALRGLKKLHDSGRFEKGAKVLLMHLGGSPAVHGYANKFDAVELKEVPYQR